MPNEKKPDLFIDDEATVNKPGALSDDEGEQTSIAVDLTPPPEKPAPSLADDDEEESTKVLDWDRAMRKSIDKK
jgi:hypothetical protein